MLSLEQIEKSILFMDDTYDANFGEWIRNEDNCRIIAYNMKKYVDMYPVSNMIVVIKWIVKDWTLKSIIIFTKKMLFDEIKTHIGSDNILGVEKFDNLVKVISGLIYTWNPLFISEFIMATTNNFAIEEKKLLYKKLLQNFESKKLLEIFSHLEKKLEPDVKNYLFADSQSNRKRAKRSKSIVEAFNVS